MTGQKNMLPSFERPPVIETVLGVFFRPLRTFNSVRQGIFWREDLQVDFPDFEVRAPVDEIVERFDADSGYLQPGIRWQVSNEPDTPRLWAKSASGEHILQLQRNALLANWLRRAEYRPFDQRLADFERRFQQFDAFSLNSLKEQVVPVSATISYINHIPVEGGETWASAIERILTCWSSPPAKSWLPAIDRGLLQFSFAFPEDGGRLHATVTPTKSKEVASVSVQLELTGRIMFRKEQQTLAHLLTGLSMAHKWVVMGFADLTRPEMHAYWGRTQ